MGRGGRKDKRGDIEGRGHKGEKVKGGGEGRKRRREVRGEEEREGGNGGGRQTHRKTAAWARHSAKNIPQCQITA